MRGLRMNRKESLSNSITVVGGGLAGCEAAWQAARLGLEVRLFEMRPSVMTPAHTGAHLAELVCSNSLGALSSDVPAGLLKEELRLLDSLIIGCADESKVPAGGALAVDRIKFSEAIERRIEENPLIELIREEIADIESLQRPAVIATGPLTSAPLMHNLEALLGGNSLYMYDAVAPIIASDSIDLSKVYLASRYGKGEPDYLNCQMDEAQYLAFYKALVEAERVPLTRAEDIKLFEACMPIEEMADRGVDTIRFGPLKPVGLDDPATGKMPYAIVQLRKEDLPGTSYNMVGFQTRLRWPEQKRVFSMIPGLENAEFLRYGVVHRNSYLNSPGILDADMMFIDHEGLFAAGQLTGSEGYVESTATGAIAGINAARLALGLASCMFPQGSCIGALASYISKGKGTSFDPMSMNFGLLPEPTVRPKSRKSKREMQISAAKAAFNAFLSDGGGSSDGNR